MVQARAMRYGIVFANTGPAAQPDHAVGIAQAAERLGYDSLWTVEHVVVPADHESKYPYSESGRMPGGEDFDIPDPLIWLAYVAAATETIRLCTGILILPQRNPGVLAKECATLDVLSGGRLTLGIGVGWLKEEFEALGIPWERRAARTDEYVAALRTYWSEDVASFAGEFVAFERAKSFPKPPGRAIPIVVGGHSEAAARRAGRIGDGFFPAQGSPEGLGHLLDVMRRAADEAGRDADAIEVTAGASMDPAVVEKLTDLGVTRLVLPLFGRTLDERVTALEGFAAAASLGKK
jgi:probable F420-dependent oxidoreductase